MEVALLVASIGALLYAGTQLLKGHKNATTYNGGIEASTPAAVSPELEHYLNP